MKVKDSVIWITGASSGIGAELVRQLSAKGARVILSSRNEGALKEVYESAGLHAGNGMILPLDVSEFRDWQPGMLDDIEKWGPVDILINNAGVTQRSLAIETSLDVDLRIFDINYFGTIALTKRVLPGMLSRRSGHIVVISSVVGIFGSPLRTAYAASKHALHGFFDSLRAEVHDDNIRVTLICPGFIRTPISTRALTGDGSAYGKQDDAQQKGMPVDACVSRIIGAIEAEKEEVYIGRKEKVGVYMKRFFPSLFSRYIRKAKVT